MSSIGRGTSLAPFGAAASDNVIPFLRRRSAALCDNEEVAMRARAVPRVVASAAAPGSVASSVCAAIAGGDATDDPIYAAINRWFCAEAAVEAIPEDDPRADEACMEFAAAQADLAATAPTTFEGLVAYATFLEKQSRAGRFGFDDPDQRLNFYVSLRRCLCAISSSLGRRK